MTKTIHIYAPGNNNLWTRCGRLATGIEWVTAADRDKVTCKVCNLPL